MQVRTLRRGAICAFATFGLVTTVSGCRDFGFLATHHRVVHPAPGVRPVSRASLGASWHPGCPVPPAQLRAVTIRYWGFDRRTHLGTIIVNADVVHAVQTALRRLRHAHFPIRRLQPISAYAGSDNRSMRHDNTSAFNCRFAVANGPKHWSEHAFGEAIDLDPRENPYRLNGKILPASGARYADRSDVRPGMVVSSGSAVRIFDALGWGWGGRWAGTPDYQHFSVNGR